MFQRYNVVNIVVSACIVAALGLNMFEKAQHMDVVEAQSASICSHTNFTGDARDVEWGMYLDRHREKSLDASSTIEIAEYQQCIAAKQAKTAQGEDQVLNMLDGRAQPLQMTSNVVPREQKVPTANATKGIQPVSNSLRPTGTARSMPATGSSNAFPFGQCTWWADQRYYQLHGIFVPWRTNASAANWVNQAHTFGWHVSGTPKVGSIIVLQPGVQGAYSAGHVGVVEHLLSSGSVIASSMNWGSNPGKVTDYTFHLGSGVAFISLQD